MYQCALPNIYLNRPIRIIVQLSQVVCCGSVSRARCVCVLACLLARRAKLIIWFCCCPLSLIGLDVNTFCCLLPHTRTHKTVVAVVVVVSSIVLLKYNYIILSLSLWLCCENSCNFISRYCY